MHRPLIIALVLVSIVFAAAGNALAAKKAPEEFKSLFDGKTLKGWHALPGGKWEVKDGVIVGTSVRSERRHGLLASDKEYSDFVVQFKFLVVKGDSGFYFRSEKVKGAVGVHGFQMEIDNSKEVGGLYETGGRAWTKRPDPKLIKKIYKPGKWNQGSISAIGKNVTVRINGEVTSELKNDKGRLKGHFAMQLHGSMDMEVMFKDIEIREGKPAADGFKPMFNGKDLTGWKTTGNWLVKKDNVIALEPRPGEHGWTRYHAYLTTDRKYKDFILDLEFKFKKRGNSGVFLRVGDPKSQVKSGFEVQILDTHGKKKFGAHDCGGVIGTSGPSKMMVKPAGEWNRYIISVIGSQLKVNLNGEQIQDFDMSKTKLKNRPLSGYIGFQDEGKYLWYRNVRIKELNVEKKPAKPKGTSK
ncbi:MAG: DUF1080 domain-containing protein [Phycisphaerae bacterium]|jgi:hypothetical protein|nr:DUF1080 domain-containing protein [Phycisphaerae bacterium]